MTCFPLRSLRLRGENVFKRQRTRGRTQLFIAYLYKPQAQAKVLQIPVYYSHIIPSLALQACKARNTVKSRFPNPQLIVDKGARPIRRVRLAHRWQVQGPEFFANNGNPEIQIAKRIDHRPLRIQLCLSFTHLAILVQACLR